MKESNQMIIDLHTHTIHSDGELTPYELLKAAKDMGCRLIAITDHDTIAGVGEERKAAAELGIAFLPGIEITTREKEEVHVLGYGIDENNELLRAKCEEFARSREARAGLICEFLQRRGVPARLEEALEIAKGEVIGRPHFAEYIVRLGYASSQKEAFARYLNTQAFRDEVKRELLSPQDAIALIHQAGGKAVLAHPGLLKKSWEETENFVKTLKEAGLDGLEGIYQKYTPADEERFLETARKYDLATGCGSDFHGIHVKPDVPLGMKIDWTKYGELLEPITGRL